MTLQIARDLVEPNTTKIVMLVADGLGGLPLEPGTKTELESARTPNLDACVREAVCGLTIPVLPGIAASCGPGHLALFGYDPVETPLGRSVLEALSVQGSLQANDVTAIGTFCTVDETGLLTDLRGGRPNTENATLLCHALQNIALPGVELFIEPIREERFLFILRGSGLGANVSGTSPEKLGVPPTRPIGKDSESLATAKIVEKFITEAARTLDEKSPANMLTLTDFARCPVISPMSEIYGIRCVAIAIYPLYKGIARLVGMDIPNAGPSLGDQIETLRRLWGDYDFFYLHYKYADSAGCDGNFTAKVEMIERLDTEIPKIRALEPDVLIVTGDHSTPSSLRKRSWHPVPTLLWSQTCRPDQVVEFGESYCLHGGLGQLPAKHLLRLALAHSGRFGILGE